MITIVLPVLDANPYIKECIKSIFDQTYRDWKLIIFDDGSTDGTLEYLESLNDSRIKLLKRDHSYVNNLNEAFDLVDTKYIARMDADDMMYPDRLEKQLTIMESFPEIDILYSKAKVTDVEGVFNTRGVSVYDLIQYRFQDNIFTQLINPTSFIRMDYIKRTNIRYKTEFTHMEDLEFIVSSIELGANISCMNIPLLYYRSVPGSMSRDKSVNYRELWTKLALRLMEYRKSKE